MTLLMPVAALSRNGLARAALALAPAWLAASCGPDLPAFAPACPKTAVLSDAADLTQFRGTGTDLTDMVIDGRIAPPTGQCKLDDLTHLHTTISVTMDLTRGPAARQRTVPVTYFVSVSKNGTILDKQDYTLTVAFPPNSDHLRLTGDKIDLVLPEIDQNSGAAYQVLVGYQLTPEQLAFNRRRGVR